jgi:hypothetical protein
MKKIERLYLKSSEYNIARILTALAIVIENNGGTVVYKDYDKEYEITNRSIRNELNECEYRLDHAREIGAEKAIKIWSEKVNKLQAIFNESTEAQTPVKCTHLHYIRFVYEDHYYVYNVDSNPFFPFYIEKYPIVNNEYDTNRYSIEDKKEWLYDCFFRPGVNDADIKEAANLIFNMLINSKCGQLVSDRKRVHNTYDNRYHYEYIHEKRMVKVGGGF